MTAAVMDAKPRHVWDRTDYAPADICLIVEGCYPFVPGGVSGWIDWLIRTQPERTFSVVSLWPMPNDTPPRYAMPDNVVAFHPLYLQDFGGAPRATRRKPAGLDVLAACLADFMNKGGIEGLARVVNAHRDLYPAVQLSSLFNSELAWDLVGNIYRRQMPYGSFLHFFWAWRALLGGLFATLEFPLPNAKVYHTISTGYAGVLAARAALETRRPMLLTEHGIYTNERRIELLMADWVADTIDKGHALDDPRIDLRDMWIAAFEAYARTCYEAAAEVITLYEDNQRVQQRARCRAGAIAGDRQRDRGRAVCQVDAGCGYRATDHGVDRSRGADQGCEVLHHGCQDPAGQGAKSACHRDGAGR